MSINLRFQVVDARVWRIATWAAPFMIQVVLGLTVGISWLLGKSSSNVHGPVQYALGAVATLLLSAVFSTVLFRRGSPRAQGIAVSICGSFVVAIVGATVYGLWIIGW